MFKVIWRMNAGDKLHELIGYTGLTISNYSLVYIKNPSKLASSMILIVK